MRPTAPRVFGVAAPFTLTVTALVLTCAALLAPGFVLAQGSPRVEVGMSAGLTITKVSGVAAETHVGIPAGIGPFAMSSPMMYATIFATPYVILEPQLSLSSLSSRGETTTFLSVAGQVGYLLWPEAQGSPYVSVGGAFQSASGSGQGSSGPGVGGEIGYRFKVGRSLAIRLDGRYRRWFSDFKNLNEVGVGVALGAVL